MERRAPPRARRRRGESDPREREPREERFAPEAANFAEPRTENAAGTRADSSSPRAAAARCSRLCSATRSRSRCRRARRREGLDLAGLLRLRRGGSLPELVAVALVAASPAPRPATRAWAHTRRWLAPPQTRCSARWTQATRTPPSRARSATGVLPRGLSGDTRMTFASEAGADTKRGVADVIDGSTRPACAATTRCAR